MWLSVYLCECECVCSCLYYVESNVYSNNPNNLKYCTRNRYTHIYQMLRHIFVALLFTVEEGSPLLLLLFRFFFRVSILLHDIPNSRYAVFSRLSSQLNKSIKNLTSKTRTNTWKGFFFKCYENLYTPSLDRCVRVVLCCGAMPLSLQLPNIYYLFLHYIHSALFFFVEFFFLYFFFFFLQSFAFIFHFVCEMCTYSMSHRTSHVCSHLLSYTQCVALFSIVYISTFGAINAP